jgi:hypothetical protein
MKPDQVLRQYINSMGNIEEALRYVYKDARFVAAFGEESDRHHFYGTYRGVEGVRTLLSKLARDLDPQEFEIRKILADETSAFAWRRFKHRVRSTNRTFESYWAVVVEVEEGKIKDFRGFEDTGALEAAFRANLR